MEHRTLGRTGLKVSEIGFGAWAIGGNKHGNSYGVTDDEESVRAVRRALEMGCTFFDTADVYGHGHSEEILGRGLEGHRDEVVIATKVGGNFYGPQPSLDFSENYITFAVEQSLKRLKTDHIDLYQLHNPSLDMIRSGRVFEPLKKLKASGKIRFAGISIFDPDEGLEAIRHGVVDAIQVVYNIFNPAPARELFPAAKKNKIGIIAREPLANSFLTGKYQATAAFVPGDIRHNFPPAYLESRVRACESLRFLQKDGRTMAQGALQFVLANDSVSTTIPGCKTARQAEENLRAADAEPINENELEEIFELISNNFESHGCGNA